MVCPPVAYSIRCEGKHVKVAAVYPDGRCIAILEGIRNQLKGDKVIVAGEFGMASKENQFEKIHTSIMEPMSLASGLYKGDIIGQVLVDSLVRAARKLELKYFEGKEVWGLRYEVECFRRIGKPPPHHSTLGRCE